MPLRRAYGERTTWILSIAAATAVHAGVVLAIPDAPTEKPAISAVHLVWISAAAATSPAEPQPRPVSRSSDASVSAGAKPEEARRTRAVAPLTTFARRPTPARLQQAERAREVAFEGREHARSAASKLAATTTRAEAESELLPSAASFALDGQSGVDSDAAHEARGHDGAPQRGAGTVQSSHGPSLLAAINPCRGFFPTEARVDHAAVRIRVEVDALGRTRASRVLDESPEARQFHSAARACAAALRFAPAADLDGSPIAGVAKLELRFDRS